MTDTTPRSPRDLLTTAGLTASTTALTLAAAPTQARARDANSPLRDLEHNHAARLDVYGRNTRTGQVLAYRAAERFAMCSTFKTVAVAAILRNHDRCIALDTVICSPPDVPPNPFAVAGREW